MKVAKIQSSQGFKTANNRQLGIQNYDALNNYPQKVEEIVRASGTGLSCVRIYSKFIYGHGFTDATAAEVIANRRGETLDYVLKRICRDYAMYHGFAVHVNYNALYRITEMYHVPFEHCRFEARDKETRFFNKIAVYDDWTGRDPDRKAIKKEMIDFIDMFNPNPETIAMQVDAAGGWAAYKGQIYYHSGAGEKEYPAPIFEAELTNMRSEEGIDNVVGRNITCNFLPGVMIADVNNETESEEQFKDLQTEFTRYQGDENSNNIFLVQVKSKEEVPIKIDLQGENYDKEFTATQEYLPDAIGRAFNQPPILRAQDVGANFGADLMTNAYKFYNTQTEDERQDIAAVFARLFQYWRLPGELTDATIMPLRYGGDPIASDIPVEMLKDLTPDERRELIGYEPLGDNSSGEQLLAEKLGVGGTQSMVSIVENEKMSEGQKHNLLMLLFGLTPEQATNISKR